jgi:hypothetical protein
VKSTNYEGPYFAVFFLFSNYRSSVGIATGYWLDHRGSIRGRDKKFFSTPERSDRLWGPVSYPMGTGGSLLPGVKRQGREADHTPPSSAEVKNGGAIRPLPHISLWRGA